MRTEKSARPTRDPRLAATDRVRFAKTAREVIDEMERKDGRPAAKAMIGGDRRSTGLKAPTWLGRGNLGVTGPKEIEVPSRDANKPATYGELVEKVSLAYSKYSDMNTDFRQSAKRQAIDKK